jgi:hypothetical protein
MFRNIFNKVIDSKIMPTDKQLFDSWKADYFLGLNTKQRDCTNMHSELESIAQSSTDELTTTAVLIYLGSIAYDSNSEELIIKYK